MVAQALAQVLQGLQWHKGHDSEWSLDHEAEEEAVLTAEEAASSHGEVRQSPSWSLRTDARGWFGRWFTSKKRHKCVALGCKRMHPCRGGNCSHRGAWLPFGDYRFNETRRIQCCKVNEEKSKEHVAATQAGGRKSTMDKLIAEDLAKGIITTPEGVCVCVLAFRHPFFGRSGS